MTARRLSYTSIGGARRSSIASVRRSSMSSCGSSEAPSDAADDDDDDDVASVVSSVMGSIELGPSLAFRRTSQQSHQSKGRTSLKGAVDRVSMYVEPPKEDGLNEADGTDSRKSSMIGLLQKLQSSRLGVSRESLMQGVMRPQMLRGSDESAGRRSRQGLPVHRKERKASLDMSPVALTATQFHYAERRNAINGSLDAPSFTLPGVSRVIANKRAGKGYTPTGARHDNTAALEARAQIRATADSAVKAFHKITSAQRAAGRQQRLRARAARKATLVATRLRMNRRRGIATRLGARPPAGSAWPGTPYGDHDAEVQSPATPATPATFKHVVLETPEDQTHSSTWGSMQTGDLLALRTPTPAGGAAATPLTNLRLQSQGEIIEEEAESADVPLTLEMAQRVWRQVRNTSPKLGAVISKFGRVETYRYTQETCAQRLGLTDEEWRIGDIYRTSPASLIALAEEKRRHQESQAAVKLQAAWRSCVVRGFWRIVLQGRMDALRRIQRWFRVYITFALPLMRCLRDRRKKEFAALQLQRTYRGWVTRRFFRCRLEVRRVSANLDQLRRTLNRRSIRHLHSAQVCAKRFAAYIRLRIAQRIEAAALAEVARTAKAVAPKERGKRQTGVFQHRSPVTFSALSSSSRSGSKPPKAPTTEQDEEITDADLTGVSANAGVSSQAPTACPSRCSSRSRATPATWATLTPTPPPRPGSVKAGATAPWPHFQARGRRHFLQYA
mmetsp:Transcript_59739/g.142138  ORF Transcript_59739/g.142138 Transcript_59739/m.142138 type:complete len:729 (-) Transcript_59739:36-2222(-)